MSDFDLETAVVAARRHAAEVTNDGSATRLRIRETLARRPARTRRTAILTALMATIFGSTAFAYYAGWRPPWTEPRSVAPSAPLAASSKEPHAPSAKPRRAPAIPPPIDVVSSEAIPVEAPPVEAVRVEAAPPQAPTPVVVKAAPQPVQRAKPTSPAPRVAVLTEPVVEAPDTEPSIIAPPQKRDPELAAYRVAHEAHVRGGDPVAALRAWDAYLAAFPNGALAVDARYSRALILIKLERWSDAANALRPFAEAPAGTYRQGEAARLLAAFHAR